MTCVRVVVVTLLVAMLAIAAMSSTRAASAALNRGKTQSIVKLQEGRSGNKRWAFFLSEAASNSGQGISVCVGAVMKMHRRGGGQSVQNGPMECRRFGKGGVELESVAIQMREPDTRITAFVFGGAVRRVEFVYSSGKRIIVGARRVPPGGNGQPAIRGLKFLVRKDQGPDCLTALRARDQQGDVVVGSRLATC